MQINTYNGGYPKLAPVHAHIPDFDLEASLERNVLPPEVVF